MTLQELIEQAEQKLQKATEAFTKAQVERDPNLKFVEDELIRATDELNNLKMRRPV